MTEKRQTLYLLAHSGPFSPDLFFMKPDLSGVGGMGEDRDWPKILRAIEDLSEAKTAAGAIPECSVLPVHIGEDGMISVLDADQNAISFKFDARIPLVGALGVKNLFSEALARSLEWALEDPCEEAVAMAATGPEGGTYRAVFSEDSDGFPAMSVTRDGSPVSAISLDEEERSFQAIWEFHEVLISPSMSPEP